ncbi:tonB-system energizer ExbB [Aurantiacibacter flavus]|uniref:Biopolymer transport protein ExbB n=1 Tax=Aurantiacibacter flavus TaxID=3145232 RepID=A0ABV0CZB0_9SPHN
MIRLRHSAALYAGLSALLIPAPVLAQPVVPASLSVGSMFMEADWVVKVVMIGLIVASLITWTIAIAKGLELGKEGKRQLALNAKVIGARSLADARKAAPEASDLLDAAALEITLSADALDDLDGIRERIATRFARLEAETGRKLARGIHVLATIGATAPFVGLFGTVWGIMNAFIGIAEMQTTNLAVVAPGIAEALLATGVGLFAAIPAVVIYNHFARKVAEQRALAADRAAAILNIASRDLSRGVAAKDL